MIGSENSQMCGCSFGQHLICFGYVVQFIKGRKPPVSPPDWWMAMILEKGQMKVIREEIKDLCRKGVMRRISGEEANCVPGFYS